jgi:hypothetical protein
MSQPDNQPDQTQTLEAELAEYDWCVNCGELARVCDLNPHGCQTQPCVHEADE